MYTFLILQLYACILFFKILINLPDTTNLPSLCVGYISMTFSCNHDFVDLDYTEITASISLVWFTTKFIQDILECIGDFNIFCPSAEEHMHSWRK